MSMSNEPYDRWWTLKDARTLPEDAAAVLAADGALGIRACISEEDAAALRDHIDDELERRLRECDGCEQMASRWFGNVYERQQRYDLRLSIEAPAVKKVLSSLCAALEPLLVEVVTEDALVVELSCVVSDPGSACQPWHSDTAWAPMPLYTVFVALQCIHPSMGPTQVALGTHTEQWHQSGGLQDHGRPQPSAGLADDNSGWETHQQAHPVPCNAGDAYVMDSRLYHQGCANKSDQRRRVLCASFAVPHCEPPGSTYSLLYEMRGKLRLKNWHSW